MPTFTVDGVNYDYLQAAPDAGPEQTHSWEYGEWPRVQVAVPLAAGGTVSVYGQASRWAGSYILVVWVADAGAHHSTWIPKANATAPHAIGVGHHRVPRRPGEPAPRALGETPTRLPAGVGGTPVAEV